jgi:hypothetical protein
LEFCFTHCPQINQLTRVQYFSFSCIFSFVVPSSCV